MVRKFLIAVAVIAALAIAAGFALNIYSTEATKIAFVPRGEFVEQEALERNAYEAPDMWYSRPGLGRSDPSRYQPASSDAEATEDAIVSPDNPAAEQSLDNPDPSSTVSPGRTDAGAQENADGPSFAVFFVHPTSYIPNFVGDELQWNAALGDMQAETRARLFLRGTASAFNRADEIWAPRYRQATAGAFLTNAPEASRAIDAAYRDVALAFDYFLESVDAEKPIVLAGHSQGSLHILRLLMERAKGTDLMDRIAAVYAIGWPVSLAHDLPEIGLPACATAGQPRCVMSYVSFADGGDPELLLERYKTTPGFDGEERGDGPILCSNPLTGGIGGTVPASENIGTFVPDESLSRAQLIAGLVPASCNDRGMLLIGDAPEMGPGVLPGGNYHVYDIPLFWANLQRDVTQRVAGWKRL